MPHLISRKKRIYAARPAFAAYLAQYDRMVKLPVRYDDLLRYEQAIPLYDKAGRDTLWVSVLYSVHDQREVREGLMQIYAHMKTGGETDAFDHLVVDRVDLCTYGNTQPFRVRIVNTLNDNFDYFYVKRADASRLYGLELEHMLSPNVITFLYDRDTLVEEHISGIPGNMFIRSYLRDRHLDEVRLAKEFVKFNERCFLRLLGDMHSANFVIDITPDFEETTYRTAGHRLRSAELRGQAPGLSAAVLQAEQSDHLPRHQVHVARDRAPVSARGALADPTAREVFGRSARRPAVGDGAGRYRARRARGPAGRRDGRALRTRELPALSQHGRAGDRAPVHVGAAPRRVVRHQTSRGSSARRRAPCFRAPMLSPWLFFMVITLPT